MENLSKREQQLLGGIDYMLRKMLEDLSKDLVYDIEKEQWTSKTHEEEKRRLQEFENQQLTE